METTIHGEYIPKIRVAAAGSGYSVIWGLPRSGDTEETSWPTDQWTTDTMNSVDCCNGVYTLWFINKNSSGDEIANVNFYAVRPEGTRIRWNYAKWRPLRRSRSFKVTDFGTNRNLTYDFLLVIHTNLPPILHRFRDIAVDRSEIAIFCYPSRA